MAAAYIDADYIDAFIGADVRAALFTTPSAAYSATHLATVIEAVSADIQSAAKNAGYTIGDTSTDPIVQKATLVAFLQTVNSRKGITVGENLIQMWGGYIDAIVTGKAPLAGQPDTRAAVGGAEFSPTSGTSTATAPTFPPVLSIAKTTGY